MINFLAIRSGKIWPSFILGLLLVFEAGFGRFWLESADWFGFMVGLAAFGAVFLSLEALARRVLVKGSVRGGVISGFFWFGVKFLGPLGLFYYARSRDFPIFFVFVGLSVGLVTVSLILWVFSRFRVDNY
jgi:hypothetical protein